jgi:hypothetical protein
MEKQIIWITFGIVIVVGIILFYLVLENSQQQVVKNKIENYFSTKFNTLINITKFQDIGNFYKISFYFGGNAYNGLVSKNGKYLFLIIGNLSTQSIPQTELKDRIKNYLLNKFNISINAVDIQDTEKIYAAPVYDITLYLDQGVFDVFASKDGRYLLSQPINLTIPSFSPALSNFPDVKLFVMSFCPYGTQAELFMKPVYDILKNNANFSLIFIVSVNGNNLSSVDSLHGPLEVLEDARQICIQKIYGKDTLWNYIENFDKNCYPNYVQNIQSYSTCTLNEEKKLNINSTLIQNCMNSSEVIQTLKQYQNLTEQYHVYGSPTLVVNNLTYEDNFGRSTQAYQKAICLAFTSQPASCSKTLNSTSSSAPAGHC